MPHFIVEYSTNIEAELDVPRLFERLSDAAVATGDFPLAGIRCRALPRDTYRLADGHPDNAFIHVQLRVGAGRTVETLHAAGEKVFAVLQDHLETLFAERPMMLTFEIAEIHPDLNFKKSNVRDYIAAREGREAAE